MKTELSQEVLVLFFLILLTLDSKYSNQHVSTTNCTQWEQTGTMSRRY